MTHGFVGAHGSLVRRVNVGVVLAGPIPDGRITVVFGAGSSHDPVFARLYPPLARAQCCDGLPICLSVGTVALWRCGGSRRKMLTLRRHHQSAHGSHGTDCRGRGAAGDVTSAAAKTLDQLPMTGRARLRGEKSLGGRVGRSRLVSWPTPTSGWWRTRTRTWTQTQTRTPPLR